MSFARYRRLEAQEPSRALEIALSSKAAILDGSPISNHRKRSPLRCHAANDTRGRAGLAADYGHGLLNAVAVKILSEKSRFLALNAQMNADNRGFNPLSRYSRADFISTSENEIRLEVRSRTRDLRDIVREVSAKLQCERVIVTRGKYGCLVNIGRTFRRFQRSRPTWWTASALAMPCSELRRCALSRGTSMIWDVNRSSTARS